MINFISNLPGDLRSGGFSALGAAAHDALESAGPIHYAGPISPEPVLREKVLSKARRLAGMPGRYYFFSERRLRTIADEVAAGCTAEASMDYFHGFTPWIMTSPPRPYVACSDCTFRDYITNYHVRAAFNACDLERIERAEAEWLKRAARVLFTSQWAASRAIADYGLDPAGVAVTGIFGELQVPEFDEYGGGTQFAFLSTNFAAKGGTTLLEAFARLRTRHPEASLMVVGDHPPGVSGPAVSVCGFLRKEVPEEHARYREILANSRALVHPTRSDSAPLIVIEAGYFGCPAISTRRFAIPELIDGGRTGLLLEDPTDPQELAAAMAWMLEREPEYRTMRHAVRAKATREHSKHRFMEQVREQCAIVSAPIAGNPP